MPVSKKIAKNSHDKKTKIMKFIAMAAVVLIALILIDSQLRPVIKTMSSYHVQKLAARAITEAVYNQIDKNGVRYENLIELSRNSNGEITSIESNIAGVNRVNADITQNIINNLSELESVGINIPLGTLLGIPIFSGRGPPIEIKVVPSGYVNTKITSNFKSAGINQTHHTIDIEIHVLVTAIIPGYSSSADVTSGFQIAETIIVGDVPGSFTQVLLDTTN
ncbi:MAG: sporulation protein YunB [Oscillospiraceae bacterium]|nr:sporulation protein YunB [Oscillospiraceae bacterium]